MPGQENLRFYVHYRRSFVFYFFELIYDLYSAILADADSILILSKLCNIHVEFIKVDEDVLYLFGLAGVFVKDLGLVAASSMWVPQEDGDSIGVEDYFGAKAADGALENLLEGHGGQYMFSIFVYLGILCIFIS